MVVKDISSEVLSILDTGKSKGKATKSKEKKVKTPKLTKKQEQIQILARQTILPEHYETVWTQEQLIEMVNFLSDKEVIAVDTETYGVEAFIHDTVGFSLYTPNRGFYVPIHHIDDINQSQDAREKYEALKSIATNKLRVGYDYVECLPRKLVSDIVRPLLEDRTKKFIGHNCKFDSHILRNWYGINIKWFFDTMIAQALLDENQSKRLKEMAVMYLKVKADTFSKLFGKTTFDKVPILMDDNRAGSLASYYAIYDTELTYMMYEFQMRHLSSPNLKQLHYLMFDIEMPFLDIVIEAEARGVKLDTDYLNNEVAPKLNEEIEELRANLFKHLGEINLNSPQQLSKAMFDDLKFPVLDPKTPRTTAGDTLSKLLLFSSAIVRDTEAMVERVMSNSKAKYYRELGVVHSFIYGNKLGRHAKADIVEKAKEYFSIVSEVSRDLLEYRSKTKLTSSFAVKLPKSAVNGRVHTSFSSVGTVTGRMSSSSPNLQQIPSRVGGLIRNAFVADEGRVLVSIDFSQQELRVLTHVSSDPVLMKIYTDGGDVHATTAVGMINRKNPNSQITYDDFQFGRKVSNLFRNADGEIVEDRLTTENISKLVAEGKLDGRMVDPHELRRWAELGEEFEAYRSRAKTVNFGRH